MYVYVYIYLYIYICIYIYINIHVTQSAQTSQKQDVYNRYVIISRLSPKWLWATQALRLMMYVLYSELLHCL